MKDKEKQIEEIKQVINDHYHNGNIANKKSLSEKIYDTLFPEDSVVLTREEYEKTIYSKMRFGIDIGKTQARKEIAEKILKPLYDACKEDCYGQTVVDYAILEDFAKQFGVEI